MDDCSRNKEKEIDHAFELCKQLHQQYAEADNNKTKSIISFIKSIAFIFSAFGIYLYYKFHDIVCFEDENDVKIFIAISSIVLILLILINLIVLISGYSLRRDQFIINRIRFLFCGAYRIVFGSDYNPYGKKIFSFLPDLYHVMFCFLFIIEFVLSLYIGNTIPSTKHSFCRFWISFGVLLINIALYLHYYYRYKVIENTKINDSEIKKNDIIIVSFKCYKKLFSFLSFIFLILFVLCWVHMYLN